MGIFKAHTYVGFDEAEVRISRKKNRERNHYVCDDHHS